MRKSLADRIEQYIKVLIDRSDENQIEIQRAELAETFSCVPSQVTYVISTRFTENEGYFTQSRRGGKGYVRITRCYYPSEITVDGDQQLYDWLEQIEDNGLLTPNECRLVKHLVFHGLNRIPSEHHNNYRTGIIEAIKSFLQK